MTFDILILLFTNFLINSNQFAERQKIMCAGKALKDDEWNIPLKNVSSWTEKFLLSHALLFLCL